MDLLPYLSTCLKLEKMNGLAVVLKDIKKNNKIVGYNI